MWALIVVWMKSPGGGGGYTPFGPIGGTPRVGFWGFWDVCRGGSGPDLSPGNLLDPDFRGPALALWAKNAPKKGPKSAFFQKMRFSTLD